MGILKWSHSYIWTIIFALSMNRIDSLAITLWIVWWMHFLVSYHSHHSLLSSCKSQMGMNSLTLPLPMYYSKCKEYSVDLLFYRIVWIYYSLIRIAPEISFHLSSEYKLYLLHSLSIDKLFSTYSSDSSATHWISYSSIGILFSCHKL